MYTLCASLGEQLPFCLVSPCLPFCPSGRSLTLDFCCDSLQHIMNLDLPFSSIYIYSQKPLFNVQHLTTRVRKSSMTFESTWDPIIFIQYHLSFSVCWIHYPLNHPPKDQQPEVGNKMTCSQDVYHQQHQLCWISTGVMSTDLQSTWKRKHRSSTGAIGSAKLQWDSSQHLTWEEQEKWHHVWELHT